MQVRAKKNKQRRLRDTLKQAKRSLPRNIERALLDKAEILTWLQRLYAIKEYESTGSSAIITRDAEHLGKTPEEVIKAYYTRMSQIDNHLWEVLADDLI